ncbi:2,3,4,5-tetrahydropyridine-2,6-dicarboxylate N-succinyltransferase [Bdellovibrio bacteriovorus]|uniref:2,3,4,5-tetrahydropyridine-2,6-dicarboxylate N-succinyltransferase n=1 Tax=Bdellovibrio bacteriovorus TaxID=959 RepID=A0A150WU76_BDEBC|nr:2,3,4,5-tetrahydropyridine-2,6-dicarboxylate N-succinyltransferase [Bdellovibrio bacteriovorus]KYG69852.1 2,3,4,5-tetrahydropyridine-2,6-dicarboxylate N-succinyltransferase [Bdellovibrio bacteriovorus]
MQNEVTQIYADVQNGKTVDTMTTTELKSVFETIEGLDSGRLRVCEKTSNGWITHEWIKKAILLYFRIQKMDVMKAGDFTYFDKIPVKQWSEEEGVRVVPHALARKGCFIEKGAILMPSYVNIGAYVGSGTMVDTWATVGSCAQIGKNVHLSGGVGIGGVLEPVQASPVIVEDNVFIGSRCIVVEGALIEEGAVLGAGVTITASTKIIDVTGSSPVEYKGRVPANCVVIPGTQMKDFAAGTYGVPCALIIGKRKPSTDLKTSLTDALRDYQVSV